MPRQGVRLPVNKWGNLMGKMTASFNASLAISSPATSSQRTFGLSTRIALVRPARSFFTSGSPSSSSFLETPARHHVLQQRRLGDGEKLTSFLRRRAPHSQSHSHLSLVARAFRLLVTSVP